MVRTRPQVTSIAGVILADIYDQPDSRLAPRMLIYLYFGGR